MINPLYQNGIVSRPKPVCSWDILRDCVAPQRELLLELRTKETGQSIDCECEQNCVDSDVFINNFKILVDTNELLGTIGGIIIVREYPLVRYKRKILFSLTDLFGKVFMLCIQFCTLLKQKWFFLLVSIGATASFFTGFCVLGIIEIAYFFTLRLFWHMMGRKIEPVELNGIKQKTNKNK